MKKSKIFAIVGIVISLGIIIALVTIYSRPYLQVSQVVSNPSEYYNKEIQVIGIVQGYYNGNFNLTENEDSILVDISQITPPSDFKNDIKVVVKGLFNSSLILVANQILTQCS